jgi:hypothetical protein
VCRKGTPESGKTRLVQSRKIAKEKNENSMLCEGSYSSMMLLKGDEGCKNLEGIALQVTGTVPLPLSHASTQ